MITLETEFGMLHLTDDHKVKTKHHGFVPASQLDNQIHVVDRGTLPDDVLSIVDDYKYDKV